MLRRSRGTARLADRRGSVIIFVAISMIAFLAFAALAVDLAHRFVVGNELHNAADAGALAAARFLYNDAGTQVNTGCNAIGWSAATANKSQNVAVEVNWTGGNSGDVERGHWSFATNTFTPNASTAPVDLWDSTTQQLDANLNFINAVRVKTRRQATKAASFFAQIFGNTGSIMNREAVAYIGYAGTLGPGEAGQPIAICKQAIVDANGAYTCGVGRMINSGQNVGHQTGGWTNFTQSPCETASTPSVRPYVCGDGNTGPIYLGQGIGTVGGELQTVYDQLRTCWVNTPGLDTDGDGWPDRPWKMTLIVIDCPGNNTGNCSTVLGAVAVDMVWITRNDKNNFREVPRRMLLNEATGEYWTCSTTATTTEAGQQCWSEFATAFNLRDVLNDSAAFYEDKTLYFLPDCTPHIPAGRTGGQNFGILARIPVLVR